MTTTTLAMGAVRDVGNVMAQVWRGQCSAVEVVQAALKYLIHPEDIPGVATDGRAWLHETAREWAKGNAGKLRLLEKSAIIERQFTRIKEAHAAAHAWGNTRVSKEQLLAQLRSTLQETTRLV
jgi:hypothetical protein